MAKIPIDRIRELQSFLADLVVKEDRVPGRIERVAGVDVAHAGDKAIACAAVLDFVSLTLVEKRISAVKCDFPYVPTLLALREGPAVCDVIDKLESKVDAYLIDGQGIAHPFRCGLATHIGVLLQIPTIGVAKKLLCGRVLEFHGNVAMVVDNGDVIGAAVRTDKSEKAIYVSVGNMVSLERAVDIVLRCSKTRIPEPIRVAHLIASRERAKLA